MSIPSNPRKPVNILAVATEWTSRNGGLSTLNRNLSVALARIGHRVVCLVADASREEVEAAAQLSVTLLKATPARGKDVGPLACLLRKPALPSDFYPGLVIGHGRVTGFAAQALVDDFFPKARRLHILHTIPAEIEWYKPRSTDASIRADGGEHEEIELSRTAWLAAGVGPRLTAELENLLAPYSLHRPVHQLNPGLDRIDGPAGALFPPRTPPRGMHCLFLGRAEDQVLKGLDIAAEAIARVRSRGMPAVLVVRGAQPNAGQKLQEELVAKIKASNSVRVKEFSSDMQAVQDDLLRASVVVMPSRSEGFGLVGLEAIESGVPTLLSDQSGLANLLCSRDFPEEVKRLAVPVTTETVDTANEWARRIDNELHDLPAAFRRAAEVRAVVAERLTWSHAATELMAAVGMPDTSVLDSPIAPDDGSVRRYPMPLDIAAMSPTEIAKALIRVAGVYVEMIVVVGDRVHIWLRETVALANALKDTILTVACLVSGMETTRTIDIGLSYTNLFPNGTGSEDAAALQLRFRFRADLVRNVGRSGLVSEDFWEHVRVVFADDNGSSAFAREVKIAFSEYERRGGIP